MKKAIFPQSQWQVLAILPATAQAVPIVGTLDLTGAVRVTPDLDRLVAGRTMGSESHALSRPALATSLRWRIP